VPVQQKAGLTGYAVSSGSGNVPAALLQGSVRIFPHPTMQELSSAAALAGVISNATEHAISAIPRKILPVSIWFSLIIHL
jgi:hypothetical protein